MNRPDISMRDDIYEDVGMTPQDLQLYVRHARSGQYLLAAGIALIIWDYLLTLNEEVEFIWKSPPLLVPAKVLFTLNRYLPLFTLMTRFLVFQSSLYDPLKCAFDTDSCKFALLSATGFAGVINVAIVEAILLFRVWVLYGKTIKTGVCLWGMYGAGLGISLAVKYLQPHTNLPFIRQPSHETSACTKIAASEMFFIYGVVLIVESVFFTILVIKVYRMRSSNTPILIALLKQGTLYYLIVLIMLMVTMAAPFSTELYWPIANAVFIVPIVSISCNRLFLSLRGMVFSAEPIRLHDLGFGFSHSTSGQARSQTPSNRQPLQPICDPIPLETTRVTTIPSVDNVPSIWINGAFAPTNPDGTPWGTEFSSANRMQISQIHGRNSQFLPSSGDRDHLIAMNLRPLVPRRF